MRAGDRPNAARLIGEKRQLVKRVRLLPLLDLLSLIGHHICIRQTLADKPPAAPGVKHEPAFGGLRDRVRPLSAYAVRFRYPGPTDPSTQEVQEALDVVREVWQFVAGRLPPEVTAEAQEG